MVDFICMSLLDPCGARIVNYNYPGPSAYEANALSVELLDLIYIDYLKMNAFYLSFLCKLPVTHGRCREWYVVYFVI